MANWKIAAVQMDCTLGDPPGNLQRVADRLERAADQGARLIAFPESILSGYCFTSKEDAWPFAEAIPGPSTDALAELCREKGVFTVIGMLETDAASGRLYNSAVLIGPDGVAALYRKIHLPMLGVDRFTTPSSQPFAVHSIDAEGASPLRVGMAICYDTSFPESARCLMLAGADLIVLPTNWPTGALKTAQLLVASRALENHLYFVAVNRIGVERGTRFIGQSRIVNPWGETLAAAEHDEECILFADIDPALARNKHIVRIPGEYELHRLRDRRPDLYAPLVRPTNEDAP